MTTVQQAYYRKDSEGRHHPRQSRIYNRLREGKPVYCFKVNVPHPMIVEIMGMVGVDCLWLDTEHFSGTTETMTTLVQAARGVDTDTVVRVPNGEYLLAAKMLDLGANAIMYPRVKDVEDVECLVRATRYRPLGERGTDFGPAAGGYGMFDFQEAVAWANEQVQLMIQVETAEALENLDRIAAVKGISMLFIGPFDLSFTLGKLCAPDAPHLADAMERVSRAAAANDIAWGMPALDMDHARRILEMGGRFISQGSDTTGLVAYGTEKQKAMAELMQAF